MADFPDHYPDSCPPTTATDGSGVVFRIVGADPIQASYFVSHYDLGTGKSAAECERRGLSVFNSYKGAQHRLHLSPHLGTRIASGELNADAGKLSLPNRGGHMTWWVCSGFDPVPLFSGVP